MNFPRKTKSAAGLCLLLFALAFCMARAAGAAEVSVNATLSTDTTDTQQSIQLSIEVSGAQSANVPTQINADGLNITHTGQQTQFQMMNFDVSSKVIHTYAVQADHPGKFTIPAVTVEVNGKNYTTKPLTLTVSQAAGGGTPPAGSQASGNPPDENPKSDAAYAELIIPRQSAYVGEVIPVELRVYFDETRIRVQQASEPDIKCEGFTFVKLTPLNHQEQIVKNGKSYLYVSFKTAVTPVKSGKLTFGPAEMQFSAQVPQRRQGHDPFQDMFPGFMGGYVTRQFNLKSNTADLDVKPLPLAGKPASFTGAVGQFSLTSSASPLKVNLGDPITVKTKITGRGDFDLITAPKMVDEEGWRSYPPSSKFTADDDIGISGSKEFEMAVIPNQPKTKLPQIEFSYFDPLTEKYATLKADQLPITVEGQAPAAPVARATPAPAKNTNDIHYIVTTPAHWEKSFVPLYRTPGFWTAQGAPFAAFLAFTGFLVYRKKEQNLLAKQQTELRKQKHDLMKILQQEDADSVSFYEAAIRYIQLAAAQHTRGNPASIGSAEAVSARKLDPATASAVQAIFGAHDEFSYAGVSATRQKISSDRRQSVLETIRKFENANV